MSLSRSLFSARIGAASLLTRVSTSARVGPSVFGAQSLLGQSKAASHQQKRFLNLHEYQSKDLMRTYNVRVQKGEPADSAEEARSIADKILAENPGAELVVKAQIHAGGRGKGTFTNGFKSGVHISTSAEAIEEATRNMLGNSLITKQTGPEGQLTQKVLVHEGISFDKEYYFAIVMDRAYNGPVLIASKEGGVDIEEVAESNPDAIVTIPIDIMEGIQDSQALQAAAALGLEGEKAQDAAVQMKNLYNLFIESDATQVEINPLVETTDGKIYCVDAKINFDDSAAYRQKALFAQRDTTMEDQREVAASKFDLNYIGLDGNIGCMVNGAGLAMATMDIIKLHGGSPANFLDVGGGATAKQVEEAFKILTSDPNVEALLVNIFGGIMRCDIIAEGIVEAAKNIKLEIPLIVRLEGTNVEKGNEILMASGIELLTAVDLDDAAIKAVASIKK